MGRMMINCREATRLALLAEDAALPWADRLRLRAHLALCRACPRFMRQLALMRQAMGPWRAYRDGGDDPPR